MIRPFLSSLLAGGILLLGNFHVQALPAVDAAFVSDHFSGSDNCADCHNGLTADDGTDVSIEADWETSMMANAAVDPFWQAKVASEMKRNPQLEHELQQVCTRCHAPMANVEAELQGTDLNLFEHGEVDPSHPLLDAAMDGVSCNLCHQIEDSELLGTEGGDTGRFSIDPASKISYGPVVAPQVSQMRSASGFTPVYSAHLSSSTACAACHDLRTQFVDADGVPVTKDGLPAHFPEQMVYSEWENSIYATEGEEARSCQDCHMPEADGVQLASRPRWLSPVDDFSRHQFLGANTVMMEIIDRNSEALGATSADFGPAIERTRAHLATSASVEVLQHTLSNGRLKVDVKVTNNGGHKLPSGYPSRRVFLNFRVSDADGNTVFESGRMNADGSIEGVAADTDRGTYENHYQVIDSPDQVQVYESVMANTDSEPTYTLLEAANYLKDNRLTPRGFDKANVPAKIGVYGLAQDDADFNAGSDTLRYDVPLGSAAGPYQVQVKLQYQALGHPYVQDLFQDSDLPAVARFADMYEASSLRAELIAQTSLSVDKSSDTVDSRLSDDFNADGRSDVLLRDTVTGSIVQWWMDGAAFSEQPMPTLDPTWKVVGVDDLDGDGQAEVLLRDSVSGRVNMWQTDGSDYTSSKVSNLSLDWALAGIGDFDGDADADVLLRSKITGEVVMWQMDGERFSIQRVSRLSHDWEVMGIGDFDGDGKDDVMLRHTQTRRVVTWEMNGSQFDIKKLTKLSSDWQMAGIGDFGGDGKSDLIFRNQATGQMVMWQMDGQNFAIIKLSRLSQDWQTVDIGDFNGDGKADMLLRHSVSGRLAMWLMNGSSFGVESVGELDLAWQVEPSL